jgi:hypothetical protein
MEERSFERRKFERVNLPASANVFIQDHSEQRVGRVRILGRGGFLLETKERFRSGSTEPLTIVAPASGIRREIEARALYTTDEGTAFEFHNLQPDAAVEVGVLLGKYYAAKSGR